MVRSDTPSGSPWTDEQVLLLFDAVQKLKGARSKLTAVIDDLENLKIGRIADHLQEFRDQIHLGYDAIQLVMQIEGERINEAAD